MNHVGTRNARLMAATPFLVVASGAIVGGGGMAAAVAHAPSQPLVWMVAYLVLVVGAAQAALGIAQAWLSVALPSPGIRATQLLLFDAGNFGVIVGTLCALWPLVLAGTVLFDAALAMFLYSARILHGGWPTHVYRLLLILLFAGATVGLVLSAFRHLHT